MAQDIHQDVHPVDQLLPIPKLLTLGLQHVLVMYAARSPCR
jgi:uric acid transporter